MQDQSRRLRPSDRYLCQGYSGIKADPERSAHQRRAPRRRTIDPVPAWCAAPAFTCRASSGQNSCRRPRSRAGPRFLAHGAHTHGEGWDCAQADDQGDLRGCARESAQVDEGSGRRRETRGQIGQLTGDFYHPSRLVQSESWAPLAKAQGGVLIVAAPATDAVLYIADDSPMGIDALRTLAKSVMDRAPNKLTSLLLRWTPAGWQIVP